MFSPKDKLDKFCSSNVVYKFTCASCSACYIGETGRRLHQRIDEHLRSDKNSHIYKHLHNNIQCFDNCDKSCFNILDHASSKMERKLKEGLYINWEKPSLNIQQHHFNPSLPF